MSQEICTHCWGLHKTRCEVCRLTLTDWKKIVGEGVINANLYWRQTWFKMKKFQQESSGDLETDWKCRRMFGPWLKETMDRQILYGMLDKYHAGEREIKVGYLTIDSLFFIGTVLLTYNLSFTFTENMVIFNGRVNQRRDPVSEKGNEVQRQNVHLESAWGPHCMEVGSSSSTHDH